MGRHQTDAPEQTAQHSIAPRVELQFLGTSGESLSTLEGALTSVAIASDSRLASDAPAREIFEREVPMDCSRSFYASVVASVPGGAEACAGEARGKTCRRSRAPC